MTSFMMNEQKNSNKFGFHNYLCDDYQNTMQKDIETSMTQPSQNFLQYNGTVIKIKVNEWINN